MIPPAANSDPIEDRAHRWKLAVDTFSKGDLAGALFLFRTLAAEGSVSALTEIGNIYELGGGGVKRDYEQATQWYESAYRKGDVDACIALGRLYFSGHGVAKDMEKSFQLFRQAEQLESRPGSLYMLGYMHEFGLGITKDTKAAIHYYEQSVAAGHLLAARQLAVLDIKQGRWRIGLTRFVKTVLAIFQAARKNPEDRRFKVQ